MKNYLGYFSKNKEYRVIFTNSLYLILIKVATYLVPLIIIPYLFKVIGAESYGRYVFVYSVIQYLLIGVEYGFQFSGTKSVAIIGSDKNKLSDLFSAIFYSRLIISFFISILLIIIGFITNTEMKIFVFGSGIIFGTALLPLWLFQGKEKMQYITIVSIIPKLLTIVLTLIFVKNKEDYVFLTLFDSIGFLISGIVGFLIAIKIFDIRIKKFNLIEVKTQLSNGWHVFLSTILISFYRQANIIILSIVGNYTVVGYYSVAEKIVKAIQSASTPITQAIFPYFSRKLNIENKHIFIGQFIKWGKIFAISFLSLTIIIMFLSKIIINLYLGKAFEQISVNLLILSPIIFVGFLNYFYGIVGLMNLGHQKYFNRSILVAAIFNIITCFILGYYLGDIGASISLLLAETLLFSLLIYYFKILESINIFSYDKHYISHNTNLQSTGKK